jgi:phosphoribosyl-dephospho-CoA transferase
MTGTSNELTQPSSDTTTVLPNLSENKAPLSLTLTIDKSVKKVAEWIMVLLIGMTAVTSVCATLTIVMFISKNDRETAVNSRLQVSENHWRDLEVTQKIQQGDIDKLNRSANDDRRR